MMDNDPNVRRFAAQLVGKIATIEIPEGLWNNVVNVLLNNVVSPQAPASLKQSTLECFGYICEGVKPEVLSAASDQILTAIIQGMRSEETDLNVKHAAAKALNHALEFSSKYFESDEQREFIMKVVIESAGMPGNGPEHVRVRKAAMECLVQIASLYYSKLMPYMSKIFTLTWRAIKEDDERVALQAIEFWSSICDEELDIKEDMEYNPEEGRQGQNFIKRAVQYLAPVLTEALLRGDDEPDPETWNVPQAAGTCLGSIARNVEDDVVAHVLPFVEANITDQNPRCVFVFIALPIGQTVVW
jgi:importin subunit beta-1